MLTIGSVNLSGLPDLLAVCFEVFIVWIFQKNWFVPKLRKKSTIIVAYLAFGIFTGAVSILYPSVIVLPIVAYVGILVVSLFLYQGNFLSHIFSALLLLIIGIVCEIIVATIYSGILGIDLAQMRDDTLSLAIGTLISKMLCLLIVGAIVYHAGKRKSSYSRTIWKTVPLLVCQLILVSMVILVFFNAYYNYRIVSNLDIAKIVCILFVSIFVYTYYDVMVRENELKYMNNLTQIQLENHIKHHDQIREQEEVLISIEHDCRKFVAVLDNLIKNGHIDESNKYKASFEEFLDNNINLAFIPHPVVSAIINNCLRRSQALGVKTNYDIRIPKALKVSDIDLTIILGNILDNALEALEHIADGQEKTMQIKIIQNKSLLLFEVENSYNPDVVNKRLKKTYNGYGLKNVQACVTKYSGEFDIHKGNNVFKATIIINTTAPN